MKLNKQMWLIIAIILLGIIAAGLILKIEKPAMDEHGHGEHAEEANASVGDAMKKRPAHGEAEHNHEKDHLASSTAKDTLSEQGHNHPAMVKESVKGPHGGKLFTDGEYAIEVTIFEQNQPPQFRLYTYLNNKLLVPKDSLIKLTLKRLGRDTELFNLIPENNYLTSNTTVVEPHSFKVKIDASYEGKAHTFSYDQVEARVTLTNEQLKHNAIEVLTAGPANIQTNLRLIGEITLNADKAVQVLPRLGGIVESVAANVGGTVKKGQTLAVISSTGVAENRGDLAAAQQRLSLAKTTFAREESLWREKISAEQDYLAAKNELELAQIEVSRQRQILLGMGIGSGSGTRYTLTAPISGVVTRKQISVGQVVDMSQILFEIADLNTVWAEISVPTKDLGVVKTGQQVTVAATAFAQTETGVITYIAPLVNAQSRTAVARVVLPNPKRSWLVGLPVNIDLVANEVNVPLAVSVEAIQSLHYGDVVFGRYGEYFEARPVELGRRDNKYVEVLTGLNNGEQYAAGNSFVVKAELGKAGATHDH